MAFTLCVFGFSAYGMYLWATIHYGGETYGAAAGTIALLVITVGTCRALWFLPPDRAPSEAELRMQALYAKYSFWQIIWGLLQLPYQLWQERREERALLRDGQRK